MHVILHTQIERHSFVDSVKPVAFIIRVDMINKEYMSNQFTNKKKERLTNRQKYHQTVRQAHRKQNKRNHR